MRERDIWKIYCVMTNFDLGKSYMVLKHYVCNVFCFQYPPSVWFYIIQFFFYT